MLTEKPYHAPLYPSPPLASLCIPSLPPKSPTSEPEGLIKEAVKLCFLSLLVSSKLLQHREAKMLQATANKMMKNRKIKP